ncbi:GNAT family N-acetyltransferase [Pseudoxanthomonas sp.]|uniref:GNAT family N-acetyltransferase n=1 Tax=Pseudoxanthomonas sp. TaxID=1871049 RepID=UPI00258901E8|nr:GNAT family N-acetyltransferase [Pseudoxanthomonas sp.]MCR6685720.1 GNAT family N-acetyltransferase [Pseudoxanthomonas sp.]
MQIVVDPLDGPEIAALLREHLDEMHRISPPESVHAHDLSRLRAADITFWSAWKEGVLLGCAALKELDGWHGEVKSMRTVQAARGRGIGAALLQRLMDEAQARGYRRLSLETGTQVEFAPARALYARFGFVPCGPFAGYVEDPCSTFMTRALSAAHSEN